MRRRLLLAAPALAALSGAPGILHAAPGGVVRAVASFSILADMVRQIGGDRIAVTSIVPANADAHEYELRSADARAVAAASLVVENGLGLDAWLDRLLRSTGFAGVRTVASSAVTARSVPGGHGAASVDPHAWQDPRNGVLYAQAIAAGLATADPAHADAYGAAADRYDDAVRRMDAWIAEQYAPIPASLRRIITTHDAFGYYGDRYGIEFLAAQGLSTEAEPSARAIAALIGQIRREKIRAVFLENMTDPRLAEMLMRETGATLGGTVYSDALSGPEGPAATYLDMLRHNTTLFVAAMRR